MKKLFAIAIFQVFIVAASLAQDAPKKVPPPPPPKPDLSKTHFAKPKLAPPTPDAPNGKVPPPPPPAPPAESAHKNQTTKKAVKFAPPKIVKDTLK